MNDDLLSDLVSKPQRETSGSDTVTRYEYQRDWALYEAINRHQTDQNYLVAFEYHDDVLFFDDENDPKAVEFFQVKTTKSAGPKRLSTLTRKSKDGSALGKLFKNTENMKDNINVRMIIVCNKEFDFSNKNICASEIKKTYKSKLIAALKDEVEGFDESILDKLHFYVTEIPVDKIEQYLIGLSTELFENRFGKNFSCNVLTWLRLVRGEITRKNNFSAENINDIKALIEKKCIGRSVIDKTLAEIEELHVPPPNMATVSQELRESGWSGAKILAMEKALARSLQDYRDPLNRECQQLCVAIGQEMASHPGKLIGNIIDDAVEAVRRGAPPPYSSAEQLNALSLLVFFYEKL